MQQRSWFGKVGWVAWLFSLAPACRSPKSADDWNEQTLCQFPSDWVRLQLVDEAGHAVRHAWVWTEACLREGQMVFGESEGRSVVHRGPASTSNEQGEVLVCDVARPLVREYGVDGWQSSSFAGTVWRSVVTVELRVEGEGDHRARITHFFSAAFGQGRLTPLPARVIVSEPTRPPDGGASRSPIR